VAQIKLLFTFETMKPSLSKINPIEGVKRICSMKSIVELIKQLLKLGVIAWLCVKAVQDDMPKFAIGPEMDLVTTIKLVGVVVERCIKWVLGGMVCISGLDYFWQSKQFMKQMRMSHQDMKDEYKETEGNPHVKAKMRQMMRQGAQGRMMEEVPNASAVVTNPTHMAIAIRYKPGEDQVPYGRGQGGTPQGPADQGARRRSRDSLDRKCRVGSGALRSVRGRTGHTYRNVQSRRGNFGLRHQAKA